jgi:hypothetical protein
MVGRVPWAMEAPKATAASVRPGAGDHAVHFYADEDELAAVVAGHLGPAIAGGDEAAVIADPDHRAAFRGALARAGIDVSAAEAAGRQAAATRRPVHAYGEMVSLRCRDGHAVGAIELEQLWDGLAGQVPFSLLCSYSRELMRGRAAEPGGLDVVGSITAGWGYTARPGGRLDPAEISWLRKR